MHNIKEKIKIYNFIFLLFLSLVSYASESQNQSIDGDCNLQIQGDKSNVQINCIPSKENITDIIRRGNIEKIEKLKLNVEDFSQALNSPVTSDQPIVVSFFESIKNQSKAEAFLKNMFNNGLDPNLIIKIDKDRYTTLFWASIDAGNANLAKFLLRSGASPHTPEYFYESKQYLPRFAWPMEFIYKNAAKLSRLEREEIIKEMIENNVIISYDDILIKNRPSVIPSEDTPNICMGQYKKMCEKASQRDGFDWCGFIKNNGTKKRKFEMVVGISVHDYIEFTPEYILSITKNRNVLIRGDIGKGYSNLAILQISPDNDWVIYAYTRDACQSKYDCWIGNGLLWDSNSDVLTTRYDKEVPSIQYCN